MPALAERLSRAVLLSLAASILLFGCGGNGGNSEAEKAEERVAQKFGEAGMIRVGIVLRAYEEGRLGTREQVEADMERFFSPPDFGYKIPKPFDSSGKIMPLSSMTDEQIAAFSEWYTSGKPYGILREEFNAAITEHLKKKDEKKD